MNNLRSITYGGGVFSKVILQFQNIEAQSPVNLKDIDGIYLQNLDSRIDRNVNPFDFIYDQKYEKDSRLLPYRSYGVHRCNIPTELMTRYRVIRDKMKIHPEVVEKYNRCLTLLPFTPKTVGVHVRLTDMNTQHGNDYGRKYFKDYEKIFDDLAIRYDKIFVAVDNKESLTKLKAKYGDKLMYCEDLFRPDSENAGTDFQLNNFSSKELWQDSFVEMLLLAKCEIIFCRVSNVINAASIYADNLKRINLI